MILPVFVIRFKWCSGVPQEVTSFEAFDKLVMDSMAGQKGTIVLLTPTITSVTTKQVIADAFQNTREAVMYNMTRIRSVVCCWQMKHPMESEPFLPIISMMRK